jgi:hypothetical protein
MNTGETFSQTESRFKTFGDFAQSNKSRIDYQIQYQRGATSGAAAPSRDPTHPPETMQPPPRSLQLLSLVALGPAAAYADPCQASLDQFCGNLAGDVFYRPQCESCVHSLVAEAKQSCTHREELAFCSSPAPPPTPVSAECSRVLVPACEADFGELSGCRHTCIATHVGPALTQTVAVRRRPRHAAGVRRLCHRVRALPRRRRRRRRRRHVVVGATMHAGGGARILRAARRPCAAARLLRDEPQRALRRHRWRSFRLRCLCRAD